MTCFTEASSWTDHYGLSHLLTDMIADTDRFATLHRNRVPTLAWVAASAMLVCAAWTSNAQAVAQDGEGTTLAQVPRAPADGGPRRWQIVDPTGADLRDLPSTDAALVRRVAHGEVLSNLGCEPVKKAVWCAAESLQGSARGFLPTDQIEPAVGPDGTVPMGINDSRQRARKNDFDAARTIRCSQERGESLGDCKASTASSGGGDAAIVVRFPNGFRRTLYFVHGDFVSADATMSGTGSDTDWTRRGDLHVIRVDDQRYELGDALLFAR